MPGVVRTPSLRFIGRPGGEVWAQWNGVRPAAAEITAQQMGGKIRSHGDRLG